MAYTTAAAPGQEARSGIQSGVSDTPTFFINGDRYDGLIRLETLLAAS
jgi:protein-disulfide isomerase